MMALEQLMQSAMDHCPSTDQKELCLVGVQFKGSAGSVAQ
jgi:hypothetical protein